MNKFASIKPLLDALSAEDLILTGEYISQQLEKQLISPAEEAASSSPGAEKTTIPEPTETESFPLLRLPRELRDEILSYAVQNTSTTIHFGSETYKQAQLHPLLHTSRQLRSEAAECFFSQHTFVFWGDANFGKLAELLAISGTSWNKFVKCVVLVPDGSEFRENPWDIYDSNWAASMSRKGRVEAGLGEGVVWTAMRRAGLGKEERWQVMGEVARSEEEDSIEMVIG